ncbi:TPA: alanine--tRNA ligase [Candidatus Bathyarchaeota archaeon]|nr:alanine--tRNA ligase [Candidatus Bathyarchaeota archaeon]
MLTSDEIRSRFLEYYRQRGHTEIPSASLLPEGDVTTLFTGSGMQPLIKYFLGEPHPAGTRIVDSQKCFRSEDIDEVGDNRHTTFFEMLGNWSLGDYFKAEQLPWVFEFLTKELGVDPSRLYVTVFAGEEKYGLPKDDESVEIWRRIFRGAGIEAKPVHIGDPDRGGEVGMQGGRIFAYSSKKNWWSRAGPPEKMPAREPGGPDSEIFYDFGTPHDPKYGPHCHPNCECGRFMEIGNSVFMEYTKTDDGRFEKLPQQNVDFGGGLERISAAVTGNSDMFQIDTLKRLIDALPGADMRSKRIIADHVRAASFLITDGVEPSNKDRGYMLRKLLRRSIVHSSMLERSENRALSASSGETLERCFGIVCDMYAGTYALDRERILSVFRAENQKFRNTFVNGMRRLDRLEAVDTDTAFTLYESFGLPYEVIKEFGGVKAASLTREAFEGKLEAHRQLSRAGAEKKFGGHGLILDTGELKAKDEAEVEKVIRMHTATHLLHAALRQVLGDEVHQSGSDITVERLRFDFSYPRKLTDEEIRRVEEIANDAVARDLKVECREMPKAEAEKSGALSFFKAKYGDTVKVYTIGDSFSKEFCGGPHVDHTGKIGRIKITKEEAVAAGVRRIRAVVE